MQVKVLDLSETYYSWDNLWICEGHLKEPRTAGQLSDLIGEKVEYNGALCKIRLLKVWIDAPLRSDFYDYGTKLTVRLEPIERPFA